MDRELINIAYWIWEVDPNLDIKVRRDDMCGYPEIVVGDRVLLVNGNLGKIFLLSALSRFLNDTCQTMAAIGDERYEKTTLLEFPEGVWI